MVVGSIDNPSHDYKLKGEQTSPVTSQFARSPIAENKPIWAKPMPLNFREGTRRLGIVAGGLGAIAGAIGGFFVAIDAHASTANRLLGEPVWVDYTVAAFLPFTGFLVPWGAIRILVWIWAGFAEQSNTRGQG